MTCLNGTSVWVRWRLATAVAVAASITAVVACGREDNDCMAATTEQACLNADASGPESECAWVEVVDAADSGECGGSNFRCMELSGVNAGCLLTCGEPRGAVFMRQTDSGLEVFAAPGICGPEPTEDGWDPCDDPATPACACACPD